MWTTTLTATGNKCYFVKVNINIFNRNWSPLNTTPEDLYGWSFLLPILDYNPIGYNLFWKVPEFLKNGEDYYFVLIPDITVIGIYYQIQNETKIELSGALVDEINTKFYTLIDLINAGRIKDD